ncbi:RICIN domain-containing protein [Streptomyces sp. NPDC046831]|uniref:RICIN domain-containing protein n=1 Tax=Streptomyces sp. NPDC046831 TaxID=3154805 RepID=UPI0033CE389A
MPTPHAPRPHHPPPAGVPVESDDSLAARLRGSTDGEAAHSVALLIARHWQPAHDYAAICLASAAPIAGMVTTAAVHQVLDRLTLGEEGTALRPRLLVAVRDTVRHWAAEDRMSGVLPQWRGPTGGRGLRAPVPPAPEHGRLARRAFELLPADARCLLWHTQVEAEPVTVPAGLLGVDVETASALCRQARESFHEGCVRAHREFAPSDDCRFHNRLLDVPIRRGGTLLPDVRRHLADCRYCREAAEELGRIERDMDALLAEAVLGWGARRYLDSRPGRTQPGPTGESAARHGGGRRSGGGRRRLLSPAPSPGRRIPGGLRTPWTLSAGFGLVSAGLLATVLGVGGWPPGGTAPAAPAGVTGAAGTAPGGELPAPPTGRTVPPGAVGTPTAAEPARLRNVGAGLCLGVRGEPRPGAAATLAVCSSAWTQRWWLEKDGLLRSAADPGLCLDAYADAGVVVLGGCADAEAPRSRDVRYDLTTRGEVLSRRYQGLALASTAPGPDADVVVTARDGSAAQRWVTDPVPAAPEALSSAGTPAPRARPVDLPERTA